MNKIKNSFKLGLLSMVFALALLPSSVLAQSSSPGSDLFVPPRDAVLCQPTTLATGTAGPLTNNWVYVVGVDGIASVEFYCATNTGTNGTTMTLTIQASNNTNNVTTITNIAVITNTTAFVITNYYGGLNITNTNNILWPLGAVTIPTANNAGWATPYSASLGYTSNGAVTITPGVSGELGIPWQAATTNQQVYIRTIWTPGGTYTNCVVGAFLKSAHKY